MNQKMTIEELPKPTYYYSKHGTEAIDVIEQYELNFNLGNVIKYVLRAGKKGNKVDDLEKAIWYLYREIKNGGAL